MFSVSSPEWLFFLGSFPPFATFLSSPFPLVSSFHTHQICLCTSLHTGQWIWRQGAVPSGASHLQLMPNKWLVNDWVNEPVHEFWYALLESCCSTISFAGLYFFAFMLDFMKVWFKSATSVTELSSSSLSGLVPFAMKSTFFFLKLFFFFLYFVYFMLHDVFCRFPGLGFFMSCFLLA